MQFYEKKYKEKEKALYESINKQYLSMFPDKIVSDVRTAKQTCDNYLELKQPLKYVTPKGVPAEEITWREPKDLQLFYVNYVKIAWFLVFGVSFVFFMFIYYYWGYPV